MEKKKYKILINISDNDLIKKLNKGWKVLSVETIYDNSILVSKYGEFGKKPYKKFIIYK